jgi:hypothetical protein
MLAILRRWQSYDLYATAARGSPTPPNQLGTGGTFNFQLHPAFWLGMVVRDDQSAPNPGGSTVGGVSLPNVLCKANSDANILFSSTVTPRLKRPSSVRSRSRQVPTGWNGNTSSSRHTSKNAATASSLMHPIRANCRLGRPVALLSAARPAAASAAERLKSNTRSSKSSASSCSNANSSAADVDHSAAALGREALQIA